MAVLARKILATLLAVLFFIVNTSFTVNLHYCGTNLVSVKLNQAPKQCCKFSASKTTNFVSPKKSCCHDFTFSNNADGDFYQKEIPNARQDKKIVRANLPVCFKAHPHQWVSLPHSKAINTYIPPLLSRDVNTLFQVFRI